MSQLTGYDKFIQQALKYGFSLFGLSKTGQTAKKRAGDDGTLGKGYPATGTRFIDNGDGTVTDMGTGLMWVKDPSQLGGNFGTPGSPAGMSWENAIDECNALTYAGHSDWRLPNINELLSLCQRNLNNPCFDSTIFPNISAGVYWTSTQRAQVTAQRWSVIFNEGRTATGATLNNWLPRPVRLGVPPD